MTRHLLKRFAEFQERFFDERAFFRRLARGQQPKTLLIGCCDSRVVPEFLVQAEPGELFVVRNVANYVPPQVDVDTSVGAAIEYAVEVLGVEDLVVMGHSGCGGVRAAFDGLPGIRRKSELAGWLRGVRTNIRRAKRKSLASAVEENVLAGLRHLLTYECVKRALLGGGVHIHGWVYDLHRGALRVYEPHTGTFVSSAVGRRAAGVRA